MSEVVQAVEDHAVLTPARAPRPPLLERHFRGKLMRMYAKSAEREQRAPVALQRAADKRARKAEKRVGNV